MTTQIEMIDGLTGEKCYRSISPNIPKVSKNSERKARRYGKKIPVKLSAHASTNKDSSGLRVEWSNLYHQHRIGQNPVNILIRQGY